MKNQISENLGYMYINESVTPNNVVKNIETSKNHDIFYITFDTNLQDFDVMNRNKRLYDGDNIVDRIENDNKIQSLLYTGGWFGEWEHPFPELAGAKLSPERIQTVPPEKRAFKIMQPKKIGNVLSARIQSAQGSLGEGFGKEVLAGWIPQFSLRALAHMINKNNKPYVHVKRIITYDAPWYPSHEAAHMTGRPEATIKPVTESVTDTLHYNTTDIINGIMIPLKEILEDVGKSDVNTQMILESFDMGLESLMGFSKDHSKVMMRDDNNILYVNINPDTVKKVNDFYNSF